MKPDIKWINTAKPRKTVSIIGNRPDTIYPAHTLETPGFSPYVNRTAYYAAINCIKQIKATKDIQHAEDFLNEIDQNNSGWMDV